MKPKIYLSGAITGNPKYKKEFASTAKYLKRLGYKVVNPAAYPEHKNWDWEDYLRRDIPLLCKCDAIIMINDWRNSKGARLERFIAEKLGIEVFDLLGHIAGNPPDEAVRAY